jgi:hypothetical protein
MRRLVPAGIAVIAYLITLYVSQFFPMGFDDSYNAQLPQNLVQKGEYTSNAGDPFDVIITTGPAVLLPVAVSFLLFGVNVWAIRIVMVAFFVGMLYVTYLLFKKEDTDGASTHSLMMMVAVILLSMAVIPEGVIYIFNLLGQFPSMFYFLLGLLFFRYYTERHSLLFLVFAGVSLGLSAQSKIIMVVAFIAAGIGYLLFEWKKYPWKQYIRNAFIFGGSMLIPTFLYTLWQLIALGWTQFVATQVAFVKYSTYKSPEAVQTPFHEHIKHHFDSFLTVGITRIMVVCIVLFLLYFLWDAYQKKSYTRFTVALFTLGYWVWWIGIDLQAAIRHMVPGLLSVIILISWQFSSWKQITYTQIFSVICMLFFILHGTQFYKYSYPEFSIYKGWKDHQTQLAQYIRNNPNQLSYYYYGWFQSPDIAFLSQKPLLNSVRHADQSGTQHYYLLGDMEYNIFNFYYNYIANSRCEQPPSIKIFCAKSMEMHIHQKRK